MPNKINHLFTCVAVKEIKKKHFKILSTKYCRTYVRRAKKYTAGIKRLNSRLRGRTVRKTVPCDGPLQMK